MATTKTEPTPLELARKAYSEHFARCFECKAAKSNVCDEGKPLLLAVMKLTGDGRK